jgi:hypothetical protein
VTVTLAAEDDLSGVAQTHYQLNDSSWMTYSVPIAITNDGTSSLTYYSVDIAGNVEAAQTHIVRLDTQPPTTTLTVIGSGGMVTATLAAVDTTSGLDMTFYQLDGGQWQTYTQPITLTAGVTVTVAYYSLDIAGNYETPQTHVIPAQDTVAPTTTVILYPMDHNGWHNSPVTATLIATDTLSGVNATFYRLNNGSWQSYFEPIVLVTGGNHQLDFYSVDVVGNVEAVQSVEIWIDRVLPESAVTDVPTIVHDSLIPVSWTAVDFVSGIDEVRLWYQFGQGGLWVMSALAQSGTNDVFQFSAEDGTGTYCFATQAVDVAGNAETAPEGIGMACAIYISETQTNSIIYLPVALK